MDTTQLQEPIMGIGPTPLTRVGAAGEWLREILDRDGPILAFLAALFTGRWMLAGWNSYWLDELLSVNVYGRWHDTSIEALRHLAEYSIHPPLYQFTLYQWMNLFGDGETATRSLSNLYITAAAFCVYLLAHDLWGRRVGLLSAVGFSLMHTPTYYALESRSYAQTMFLVAMSSYLLLRLGRAVVDTPRLAQISTWLPLLLLVGTNTALLMTHYYNTFWLASQATFVAVWCLREWPARRLLTWGISTIGLAYGIPVAMFYFTWSSVFTRQFRESSGRYSLDDGTPSRGVLDLLRDLVLAPNVQTPSVASWLLVATVAAAVAAAVVSIVSRNDPDQRAASWGLLYLACWLVLPLVIVWSGFTILGVERYTQRYFVFSVVPIAPLLAVGLDRAITGVWRGNRRQAAMISTAVIAAVMLVWIVPGAHDAATTRKHDWRGIATQINDLVRADENHSYILYETANRSRPMLDYYFTQLRGNFGPQSTLARFEERSGEYRLLDEDRETVEKHDYLIVSFTHSRTLHFPQALAELENRYKIRHRQLNRMGRGFIVYELHD